MLKRIWVLLIVLIFSLGCINEKVDNNFDETTILINETQNEIIEDNNEISELNISEIGENAIEDEPEIPPSTDETIEETPQSNGSEPLVIDQTDEITEEVEEPSSTNEEPAEDIDESEELEEESITDLQEEEQTLKEKITSFIYQLQDADFEELLAQNASLIVLDPNELGVEEVAQLQNSGTIVLSYLSIGEAEKWREYWQEEWDTNLPFWIAENQTPRESLVVKYWETEWQELTLSRMEEITLLGYDGFVLDTVSTGYDYWEELGYNKTYTRDEMVKFVKKISENARDMDKLIFVNNAGGLLDKEGYLDAIDGMTSEEAFYYEDAPAEWSAWDVARLDKVIAAGKPILAIDYSTKKELQCDFIEQAKEHGFVPFVTTVELDRIIRVECN